MKIRPIKNNRDYREALKEIDRLMDARSNTPEGDRLDVLVTLAEAWEEKHWPIDSPDPVEAILFAMERRTKLFGRCEPKNGIAAENRLVAEVMAQEPYKSAQRVFGSWITALRASPQFFLP